MSGYPYVNQVADKPTQKALLYAMDLGAKVESALVALQAQVDALTTPATSTTTVINTTTTDTGGGGVTIPSNPGDIIVNAGGVLGGLAAVPPGNVLLSQGAGVIPAYGKVNLTQHVVGTLPVGKGGTGTATAFTPGSVVFAGASGIYAEDNAHFFWDDASNILTATRLLASTSVSTPSLISTGALTITPLAGQNLNVALSATGDLIVNSNQLYVDTSAARVGINTSGPTVDLMVGDDTGVRAIRIAGASTVSSYLEINGGRTWQILAEKTGGVGGDPASGFRIRDASVATDRLTINASGNIAAGLQEASARLHLLSTTEQLRLAYNTSNYNTFTVDSVGNLTIAPIGTTPHIAIASAQLQIDFNDSQVRLSTSTTSPGGFLGAIDFYNTNAEGAAVVARFQGLRGAAPLTGQWTVELRNGGGLSEVVRIDSLGRFAVGVASPTAFVHIKAGTATASTAPLKFTSGVSLTTAEAGALEFTTDNFFATITTGAARKAFVLDDGARLTSGKIPVATTNGRLIDSTAALLIAGSIPTIVATTFEKAETGSDANVLTYATGGADEYLVVTVSTDVSALTGTSLVVTVTWKDSNNATATSSITLSSVADGTINVPINAKASTNVVVSTVFVGVSTAYIISALITRLK
jgi:hypothetical protein